MIAYHNDPTVDALEPCRFCGSDQVMLCFVTGFTRSGHFVNCDSCNAAGPLHEDEDAAVAAWNTRDIREVIRIMHGPEAAQRLEAVE